jgi:hypothetical protein
MRQKLFKPVTQLFDLLHSKITDRVYSQLKVHGAKPGNLSFYWIMVSLRSETHIYRPVNS